MQQLSVLAEAVQFMRDFAKVFIKVYIFYTCQHCRQASRPLQGRFATQLVGNKMVLSCADLQGLCGIAPGLSAPPMLLTWPP